jgi:hypothetical protein
MIIILPSILVPPIIELVQRKAKYRIYFSDFIYVTMAHRKGNKTHAYSAQRSGSKKYAKVERRKRNKPKA